MGEHLGLAVAVAAFEREDRPESLLERGQRPRVMVDPVGQVADLRRHVLEFGLESGQPLGQAARTARPAAPARAPRERATAADSRAPASIGQDGVADGRCSPGDRLAVLGRRQPRPDLIGFAGPEPGAGDLGDLVLEQVDPPGKLARVDRQFIERGAVRAPALDRRRPSPPAAAS